MRVLTLVALSTLLAVPTARAAEDFVLADPTDLTHAVTFIDERSAKDLKGGMPLFFNPTYSIPDRRLTPSLLDLLGAALQAKLGDRLQGKPVTVTKLQVQNYFGATYANNQAASLAVTAAVSANTLLVVQRKGAIDATIFRAAGMVDGKVFSVEHAQPFVADSGGGMVYNREPARAATRAVAEAGIAATVDAIASILDTRPE